jgi:hypothetical protein
MSCSEKNMNTKWLHFKAHGILESDMGFNQMLVINDSIALLFGEEQTDENFKRMQQQQNLYRTEYAIICRTTNGGKSWIKRTLDKGGFWRISFDGEVLFASKSKNNGRLKPRSSVIYRSDDLGDSWEEVKEVFGDITFLKLDKHMNGIVAGIKDNKEDKIGNIVELREGKVFRKIERIKGVHNSVFHDGLFAILQQSEESSFYDRLSFYNLVEDSLATEKLPDGFSGEFVAACEENYWILGKKNNQICIYKRDSSGQYTLVSFFQKDENIFPKGIKVCGTKLIVVVGHVKGIWTENEILSSYDGGESWKSEALQKPQYFDPFDFKCSHHEIIGLAYSGSGTIQKRCE